MAGNPRRSTWFIGWEYPLPEIPTLVHFNEAHAPAGHRLPPHRHPTFELCYIVSGRAHWRNPDGEYHLGAGDLYLTLPGEEHDGVADERDPQHNFAIGFDLRLASPRLGDPDRAWSEIASVDQLLPRLRAIPGGHGTARIWMSLRQELERMPEPGDPQRPLAVAMVQALLVELAVTVTRLGIAAVHATGPAVASASMAQVCARLREQLADPPTLAEMASWIGLSPGHFAVVFKRAYQCTPHEYLTNARLAAAEARLRAEPQVPITTIALDLGFCSSQYFAEVFRRRRGISPSQWRAGANGEPGRELPTIPDAP